MKRSVIGFPVFPEVAFAFEATSLEKTPASDVVFAALAFDPMRSEGVEKHSQNGLNGFGDETFPLMMDVGYVADEELWQFPVGRPDIYLSDPFIGCLFKDADEEVFAV